jgi:phage baseplate assembly protein gpV
VNVSLFDAVERTVQAQVARLHTSALALVREQHPADPDNYACTVEIPALATVLKKVPMLTSKLGAVSMPAVGDLVLVYFVGGDVNAPVILGSLYSNEDRPPANEDGQVILHLPLGAADSDAAHIEVSSKDARSLRISMGGTVVTIQDGDPAVSIDAGGNAALTIDSNGAVQLKSSGNIEIKGDGNIKIEAGGQLTLKGATVNIN